MKFPKLLSLPLTALACLFLLTGCPKPPAPAQPTGPVKWLRGIAVSCTTRVIAPEGKEVSYQFDWGDNMRSQWSVLMDDGLPFSDTHSFQQNGDYNIRARVKVGKGTSGWSDPLSASVQVGEGGIYWSFGYTDPEDPSDSADFDANSFAMGPDSTTYVACGYGALIARKTSGTGWKFILPDGDAFTSSPVVAEDGTIYLGCTNDTFYAINPNGTVKWRHYAYGPVYGTAALGADGTVYFQNDDSLLMAVDANGTRRWAYYSQGGNSAPVIDAGGTIYTCNSVGQVFSLGPDGSPKWNYNLGPADIVAAPAIDQSRGFLYAVNTDGHLGCIDLSGGTENWYVTVGADASAPVIGADGTVYVGGGGKLWALDPDNSGNVKWSFTPTMAGVVSTPALSAEGYVYVLVVAGKKDSRMGTTDSLYGVNPDGTRRWACGLGEGFSDPSTMGSAPKVDGSGLIYVCSGYRAWCVVGIGGPAPSAWPMGFRDIRNSGRAR